MLIQAVTAAQLRAANILLEDEIATFLREPVIHRKDCLLKWWNTNKQRFPSLAVIARAFFAIPAAQANSERLNSTSGNVVSVRTGAILTEPVAELAFVHEKLQVL